MAHVLSIVSTAGTVTLASGNQALIEYQPQVSIDSGPLRERARVRFSGTSTPVIQANVNALNTLFYQAGNWTRNQTGPKVYVNFQPDGDSTIYRSQIYSGIVRPEQDMLKWEWRNKNIEFDVEWTRDPYWDGPLTQVPLTNGAGTANTSGLAVKNTTDSTHENWVSIAGTAIAGDLPAMMKVEMVNATNGNDGKEIYIFHNVHSAPSTFDHIIEAETGGTAYITTMGTADASGTAYAKIIWSASTLTKVASYPLSSAMLSEAAGGRFAILTRWYGSFPYSAAWMRWKVETTTNAYDVTVGNLTLVSTTVGGRELTLMDTMRLPPYLPGVTTQRELDLNMYMRRTGGGTVNLDYIELCPISGDTGWLRFLSVARGVPYQYAFVHDATEGQTYRTDANGNYIAEFAQYGGPILLEPGQNQRLYFTTADYLGAASIDQEWTVKLWYRPRRSSV